MPIITHFTTNENWERAVREGAYAADSLEKQGFIHCSTPEQVVGVANMIGGGGELILLWIDEAKVKPQIVYENLEGGTTLFPHIYGALNLDAVIEVTDFPRDERGMFVLPEVPTPTTKAASG